MKLHMTASDKQSAMTVSCPIIAAKSCVFHEMLLQVCLLLLMKGTLIFLLEMAGASAPFLAHNAQQWSISKMQVAFDMLLHSMTLSVFCKSVQTVHLG